MTMITPSYLGETIEYSSLHACRSTLEDPTPLQYVAPLAALALLLVIPGSLLVANLLAAWPGRRAARLHIAGTLRAE